jgi:hypothetical protein
LTQKFLQKCFYPQVAPSLIERLPVSKNTFVIAVLASLVLLVGIFDLPLSTCVDVAWSVERVDPNAGFGNGLSLAVDSADVPHMVYVGTENGTYFVQGTNFKIYRQHLVYASLGSSGWDTQTIENLNYNDSIAIDVGSVSYSALAFDSQNNPHVAFSVYTMANRESTLKYASWTGTAWSIQTVDYGSGGVLALDSSGNPHISYTGENGSLKYATRTGTNWTTQTIDPQPNNFPAAFQYLALDSEGNPNIIYCLGGSNASIKWAFADSSGWTIKTAVPNANATRISNLVLDDRGHPRFAYVNGWNNSLLYERWNGSAWIGQKVSVIYPDWSNFLRLDSNGNPHVTYNLDMHLMYAVWTGLGWDTQEVSSTAGNLGYPVPFELDSKGNPHLGYLSYRDSFSLTPVEAYVVYATIIQPVPAPTPSPSDSSLPSPTISPLSSETASRFPADASWMVAAAVAVAVAVVALAVLLRLKKSRRNHTT